MDANKKLRKLIFQLLKEQDEIAENDVRKNRMKVQSLLEKNIRPSIGSFHAKELNERGFLYDLFKHFDLIPKQNEKQKSD